MIAVLLGIERWQNMRQELQWLTHCSTATAALKQAGSLQAASYPVPHWSLEIPLEPSSPVLGLIFGMLGANLSSVLGFGPHMESTTLDSTHIGFQSVNISLGLPLSLQ